MTGNHELLRESAGDYVLGTLAADDRRAFEAHLADCDECRHEVAELAAVTEGLGRAVDLVEPPAHLRARVLAAVTAAEAGPPRTTAGPVFGMSPSAPPNAMAVASRSTLAPWLAAAASIAAIVSAGAAWNYRQDGLRARGELADLQQQVGTLTAQVATLEATATHARQTNAVLSATDLTRVELAGQPTSPVSSGRVFWSASSGLVFTATNLPALPEGRVYQLWVVDEMPRSAGVVSPDATGRLNVVSAAPISAVPKAFALTIEPSGGLPAPSGPMYLLGSL